MYKYRAIEVFLIDAYPIEGYLIGRCAVEVSGLVITLFIQWACTATSRVGRSHNSSQAEKSQSIGKSSACSKCNELLPFYYLLSEEIKRNCLQRCQIQV